MARPDRDSPADMRLRIIRIFKAERRWLGMDTIRVIDGRIRGDSAAASFYFALAWMIERAELIYSYDHDGGFGRVLWTGKQSTARAAVARADLETIREGGTS